MTSYKDAGVDIQRGDECSKLAYSAAMETFAGRKGMIGEPVTAFGPEGSGPEREEGGFTGMLDMGEFYMVQNDDGVGTKIEVAEKLGQFETLGYDLIAMVADDAVCVGAEVVSVTNTLDVPKLDKKMVEGLMMGLKKAALEQKIVVPGGELAELGTALNGAVWNATAVGIVEKHKVITGESIESGDAIIALKSDGIRSNGLTLARKILSDKFGDDWVNEDFGFGFTWGERLLRPSKIYHHALLSLIGRYGEEPTVTVKGLVHNTGGGIKGNLPRLLKKKGLGADLHRLPEPHEFMKKLQELGEVTDEEAYKTWNMGVGMLMVVAQDDVDKVVEALKHEGVEAVAAGEVTTDSEIKFSTSA